VQSLSETSEDNRTAAFKNVVHITKACKADNERNATITRQFMWVCILDNKNCVRITFHRIYKCVLYKTETVRYKNFRNYASL